MLASNNAEIETCSDTRITIICRLRIQNCEITTRSLKTMVCSRGTILQNAMTSASARSGEDCPRFLASPQNGHVSFTACVRLRHALLRSASATASRESAAEPRRPSALASTPSSGRLAGAPAHALGLLGAAPAHPMYRWPRPVPIGAAQAAGAVLKLFSRECARPTLIKSPSGQRRRLCLNAFHHSPVRELSQIAFRSFPLRNK
jgi:hypothetical protein